MKNKRIVIEEMNGDHIEEYLVSHREASSFKTILDAMVGARLVKPDKNRLIVDENGETR